MLNNLYSEYLKSMTYRQLKHEENIMKASIMRFKSIDTQAIDALALCQSLIKLKEKEIRQNGF